ncbi:MAG: UbiA-like protein EboC [Microscillaceae bacterium]|nr:UbiA-like protein EboC [Microscillaceae bacterium]
MKTLFAYLRLMRPPNLLTAVADILLGYAVSGAVIHLKDLFQYQFVHLNQLPFLILATIGLYGGGVVLNDVFDYQLDKIERPERPLPSGKASLWGATLLGIFLLAAGVLFSWLVSFLSFMIALLIVTLVISYDAWAKHHLFWGPLNMGLCRGFNLLLGVSIIGTIIQTIYVLVFIPVIYIGAITMVSQGEVHGGNLSALRVAAGMYGFVVVAILGLGFLPQYQYWTTLPFLLLFIYLIFPPLFKAMQTLAAKDVFKAVKAGVLALVVMDSALAAGFAGWEYGLLVLFLLPMSLGIAKLFAVT